MSIHARVRMPGSSLVGTVELTHGKNTAVCNGCGQTVNFYPRAYDEIIAIACRDDCKNTDGFWQHKEVICPPDPSVIKQEPVHKPLPAIPVNMPVVKQVAVEPVEAVEPEPEPVKTDKPNSCPSCGGPMKGRGYTHAEGCPLSTAAKLSALKANKSANTSAAKEICPSCGGPQKGRGYTHVDGCSQSTQAKLAAKKTTSPEKAETCPSCHGPKKGRGYTHVDGCPLSTAAKLAANVYLNRGKK